ncbi:hypothetical protein D3C79_935730 [compost metagenome]
MRTYRFIETEYPMLGREVPSFEDFRKEVALKVMTTGHGLTDVLSNYRESCLRIQTPEEFYNVMKDLVKKAEWEA